MSSLNEVLIIIIIIIIIIPRQGGKPLVWDVTVVSTLAQSYVDRAATVVGVVMEMAAEPKAEKYHNLSSDHIFRPIAMENLGAFSSSSLEFLRQHGRRLGSLSEEERSRGQLSFSAYVCCNTTIYSVLLHNGFTDDIPDLYSFQLFLCLNNNNNNN